MELEWVGSLALAILFGYSTIQQVSLSTHDDDTTKCELSNHFKHKHESQHGANSHQTAKILVNTVIINVILLNIHKIIKE